MRLCLHILPQSPSSYAFTLYRDEAIKSFDN